MSAPTFRMKKIDPSKMDRTFKLATYAVAFLTLLSEGLSVPSQVLPTSKRADQDSGQSCPPIVASTSDHSTWFPVVREGQDFHAWQQYSTTGYAEDLHIAWVRQPSALGCSQFNITEDVTDIHTINTSITVFDTRVDEGCSDEGLYQVIITSNCTLNDSIIFNMIFDNKDPCTKVVPHPENPKSIAVPEPRPHTNDSTTLCVSVRYFGSDNISLYDTQWLLGEQGSCKEKDPNLLCEDDGTDEPGSVYTCSRMIFGDCTFLSDICISNYSRLNSGNYTTMACPVSGSGPIGGISKLELSVIGWPKLTEWPGSTLSPMMDEMGVNLTYGLTNFSHKSLNITFYNGNELIANLAHFAKGYKVVITSEDNETAIIQLHIPAEGRYKMCYNFTDDVQWTGHSDFPPGYEVPNCTQYTQVPTEESIDLPWLAFIGVLILAIVVLLFVTVKRKSRNRNAKRLLNKESPSGNYGSTSNTKKDKKKSTGDEESTSVVPTEDSNSSCPPQQTHKPVTRPVARDVGGPQTFTPTVWIETSPSPVTIPMATNIASTSLLEGSQQVDKLAPLHQIPPGVSLVGNPFGATVNQQEKYVQWEEHGAAITIFPNTFPHESELQAQCCIGPFVPPQDYKLASPVYLVSSSCDLQKKIEMKLSHFADLQTKQDCLSMSFATAPVSPSYNKNGQPEYHFKCIGGGMFKPLQHDAVIQLRHFCFFGAVAHNRIADLYAVMFNSPQEPLLPSPHAVFSVSLWNPTFANVLKQQLKEDLPDNFWFTSRSVRYDTEEVIELVIPDDTIANLNYKVATDIPPIIPKLDADLPRTYRQCNTTSSPIYPPRILLTISPATVCPKRPLDCTFSIKGTTKPCAFNLLLPHVLTMKQGVQETECLPCTVGEAPTVAVLQLIEWTEEGQDKKLRIIESASTKWKELGRIFGFSESVLTGYENQEPKNQEECFCKVVENWLLNGSPKYPVSWESFIKALEDVQLRTLANDLRSALKTTHT